jgi:sugar/nucleoside kinase (ribokinase family)
LIDQDYQPRFIHTSGANRALTADVIDPPALAARGVRFFHIAGFFVLPNLFEQVAEKLIALRDLGITTSLDVVFNVRMDDKKLRGALWAALPQVDYFIANDHEAARLTGEADYEKAAARLKAKGAGNVVVKLGASGCFGLSSTYSGIVPATEVDVVDTTGAGDAFAAGFIAALYRNEEFRLACLAGNLAGGKICTRLGAITAWLEDM